MTKGLPNKSRVATVSRVRKSAMMGAAATALIAAAPTFSADAPATEASLQTTIRNILRTPAQRSIVAREARTHTGNFRRVQRDLHRQWR